MPLSHTYVSAPVPVNVISCPSQTSIIEASTGNSAIPITKGISLTVIVPDSEVPHPEEAEIV